MRNPLDLSLYLVTETRLCGTFEDVAHTCHRAMQGGVTLIQLRDKQLDTAGYVALAHAVQRRIVGHVPILIDDDIDAAIAANADGAHIGQTDMAPQEARQRLGQKRLLGLSVHNDEEMERALALPAGTIDYVGLGAVFATATKPDVPPLGLERLAHLAHRARAAGLPCVAIGGLTASHAQAIRQAGADGMAVVRVICGQHDPYHAASELAAAWKRTR